MRKKKKHKRIWSLMLAVSLLLTACGSSAEPSEETTAEASVMQLMKAEGSVGVLDDGGKDISIMERMNLYSGYQIGTESKSYAWINLDHVKLIKMDESSDAELQKNGKNLELQVRSGSLFFHVTEPLAEDETLNIRTSTMTVGIRGTCGWVHVLDESHMQVYLLEGSVHCEVTEPESGQSAAAEVAVGEMADLFLYPPEHGETRSKILKKPFSRSEIPAFVLEEVDLDALGTDLADERTGEGEVLVPVFESSEYEGYGSAQGGVIPALKEGMWGAVNYQNEVIVPFEHTNFQAPDEQGNFVLVDTTITEQTSDFLGQQQTWEEKQSSYTLFDSQGNILYEGEHQVRASGGMYILMKQGGGTDAIEYYRLDGTLVNTFPESSFCSRINGFYDGISMVYHSSSENSTWLGGQEAGYSYGTGTFQVGEVDRSGNVTWYEDPMYLEYLNKNEQLYQEALEWERSHSSSGMTANGAGASTYLPRIPLSTVNHGYYPAGNHNAETGWIAMCSDQYEFVSECDLYALQPDREQGFVRSEAFYDEMNSYRSFYHDGAYFSNYGPNMVWVLGEQDVLVDFSRYPGMTSETVDNRIVKAVYDRIFMDDENYWLVQNGEQWGFIDHDGKETAWFEDASRFYQNHALIIENGIAYLINENFEKVQELGEADSVGTYGELFSLTSGDTCRFYQFGQP